MQVVGLGRMRQPLEQRISMKRRMRWMVLSPQRLLTLCGDLRSVILLRRWRPRAGVLMLVAWVVRPEHACRVVLVVMTGLSPVRDILARTQLD